MLSAALLDAWAAFSKCLEKSHTRRTNFYINNKKNLHGDDIFMFCKSKTFVLWTTISFKLIRHRNVSLILSVLKRNV